MIGLAVEVNQGVASDIERQNRSVRRQLHERLLRLSPSEFENLIGRLLGSIGFQDVVVTGRSGDGGIDVRGTLVVSDVIRTRMAVQANAGGGTSRHQSFNRCAGASAHTVRD
jgi:restriction system protein